MEGTPVAPQGEIKLEPRDGAELVPGGFWWRFLATFLDGCILSVFMMPISIVFQIAIAAIGAVDGESTESVLLLLLVTGLQILFQLVAIFFYYGWFYSNKGATPGKMAVGLTVVNAETGTNIGYWRAFGRETIGKFISAVTLMIGFLIAGLTKEKTALHDIIFSTRVMRRNT